MVSRLSVPCRLGTEGLETAEESSSETSDGDGEEAPSTSGVNFHTPRNGNGAEAAAESAGSCPRAGVRAADSRPPEPPQTPGPGSGCGVSADAGPGRTSPGGRKQGTVAVETEKSLEQGGAGGEEPAEEGAARAGPTEETQAQEATDAAAEVVPGECGGSAPETKPEDGQSGNSVSDWGPVSGRVSLMASVSP